MTDIQTYTNAIKNDEGKNRIDLIPPECIFSLGAVLTAGLSKYDAHNWERGLNWSRVFAAAMRHLWCWWAGDKGSTRSFLFSSIDGEYGFSHLWHAFACVAFLLTYEERNIGIDDRRQI